MCREDVCREWHGVKTGCTGCGGVTGGFSFKGSNLWPVDVVSSGGVVDCERAIEEVMITK